jgi:hypothetical protein
MTSLLRVFLTALILPVLGGVSEAGLQRPSHLAPEHASPTGLVQFAKKCATKPCSAADKKESKKIKGQHKDRQKKEDPKPEKTKPGQSTG